MRFEPCINDDDFSMAGTEGTGTYVVPLKTANGKVGYRADTGRSVYRIRVEPVDAEAATRLAQHFPEGTWKQVGDGGQPRFSTQVSIHDEAGLKRVVAAAAVAIKEGAEWVRANQGAPEWAASLAQPECDREAIFARARKLGVRGLNCRWKLSTVERKLAGLETERLRLVSEVKQRKLPGCNLASTWSVGVLQSKLAD